jgi:LmbE family N-acetylglucosaminyl deacetylase
MIRETRPEILFVPYLFDMHQDHRELARAFSVAWRTSTPEGCGIRQIYAYETVSETHWGFPGLEPAFSPNVWIDISPYLNQKLESLRCFESQMQPYPAARSLQAVESLARFRGTQVGVEAAEAFVLLRHLW